MTATVDVTTIDSVDKLPITFTVELLNPKATLEHPPRLRITVENTGTEPLTLIASPMFPFSSFESEHTNPGLMVLPPTTDDRSRVEDCWQLDRLTDDPLPTRGRKDGETLEPGAATSATYEVWSHYANETCFPTGDYRFEQDYSIPDLESTVTWGFSLHVER